METKKIWWPHGILNLLLTIQSWDEGEGCEPRKNVRSQETSASETKGEVQREVITYITEDKWVNLSTLFKFETYYLFLSSCELPCFSSVNWFCIWVFLLLGSFNSLSFKWLYCSLSSAKSPFLFLFHLWLQHPAMVQGHFVIIILSLSFLK